MSAVVNTVVSNLATTASSHLTPPDPTNVTQSLIAVIGLILVAIGTRFIFNPAAAQQEFGLTHNTADPPPPQPLTLYTGWIGVRDVLVGAVLLVLGQWVEVEVVGWAVLGVMALPVMDACMAWRQKAEKAKVVSHLGTAGLCSLLAYMLLRRG